MTLEASGSHADVLRLCKLAGLPRATYYRHLDQGDLPSCEVEEFAEIAQRGS